MRSPGTITIWKTAHTNQGAENSLDFPVKVEMKRLLHSLAAVLLIILLAGCSTNSHTPTSVLANALSGRGAGRLRNTAMRQPNDAHRCRHQRQYENFNPGY